jgi:hypothetical protein
MFVYLATEIQIFATASGYAVGDYAKVYSNNGSGSVVTTAAHNAQKYDLNQTFPNNELRISTSVRVYGWWLFQVVAFDVVGNEDSGTPDEEGIWPLLKPIKPKRPVVATWDNITTELTLKRVS